MHTAIAESADPYRHKEIEARIWRAIEHAQRLGIDVGRYPYGVFESATGNWVAPTKRVCPLGALMLAEQPIPSKHQMTHQISELIGKTPEWVRSFCCGVDRGEDFYEFGIKEAFEMGDSLCEKAKGNCASL